MLEDSGDRTIFETGAQREIIEGKGRYDLLPPEALKRLAIHFENGAKKYAARNWEHGLPLTTMLDSCFRHLVRLMNGEKGEDHAAAVMWNIACFMQTAKWIQESKLPANLIKDLPRQLSINLFGEVATNEQNIPIGRVATR